MPVKAVVVDDAGTQHLIVGLNRANVESILAGEVLTRPRGFPAQLTQASYIVILFAETDADIQKCFPPALLPV
jgi:hypothetical protein